MFRTFTLAGELGLPTDRYQIPGSMWNLVVPVRKEAGYSSQEAFANDAGIPRALYGRYEKGINLTIHSLYRILKFHKITLSDFFKEGFGKL
jgi:DNA-binding XRE family transcriptional regulator